MTKVIAELGCSHSGSVERAIVMMQAAKDAGCWGVKFQRYHPNLLEHSGMSRQVGGMKDETLAIETLAKWALTMDEFVRVRGIAKEMDLKWGCTPFDGPSVSDVASLSPDFVKIYCGCPQEIVLMMLGDNRLSNAYKFESFAPQDMPKKHYGVRLVCVPIYPCEVSDYFPMPVISEGVSDHTGDYNSAKLWRNLGFEWAEVHMAIEPTDPDFASGLRPEQLKKYVDIFKVEKRVVPSISIERYWAAVRDIKMGTKIEPWVDAAPLRGVTGENLKRACPAYARKDYRKGEPL